MSRRARRADGRPQQRARGVARLGRGGGRRPRPGALRGDPGPHRARRRLERRGRARWRWCPAPTARGLLVSLDGGAARAARRGLPGPARPARRGRHGPGRAARRPACPTSAPASPPRRVAMDKALFKVFLRARRHPHARALHRDRGTSGPRDPEGARARVAAAVGYPAFCKPARLGSSVGISPVPDAGRPRRRPGAGLRPRPQGARGAGDRRARGGGRGAGRRRARRLPGGRDHLRRRLVRLRHQVRAGTHAACEVPGRPARRRSPSAPATWPCAPSPPSSCAGLARVDFFVAEDGEVLLSELNTHAGLHADERLRLAHGGRRHRLPGPGGPPGRARRSRGRRRNGATWDDRTDRASGSSPTPTSASSWTRCPRRSWRRSTAATLVLHAGDLSVPVGPRRPGPGGAGGRGARRPRPPGRARAARDGRRRGGRPPHRRWSTACAAAGGRVGHHRRASLAGRAVRYRAGLHRGARPPPRARWTASSTATGTSRSCDRVGGTLLLLARRRLPVGQPGGRPAPRTRPRRGRRPRRAPVPLAARRRRR